jgi:hypothetical protein
MRLHLLRPGPRSGMGRAHEHSTCGPNHQPGDLCPARRSHDDREQTSVGAGRACLFPRPPRRGARGGGLVSSHPPPPETSMSDEPVPAHLVLYSRKKLVKLALVAMAMTGTSSLGSEAFTARSPSRGVLHGSSAFPPMSIPSALAKALHFMSRNRSEERSDLHVGASYIRTKFA